MTASRSRIPESLQNVFVASQTGEDVDMIMAPAEGVSCKTFAPSGGCNSDSYALRKSRPSALGIKLLNRADHVGVTAADATKVLLRQQRASQRFLKQQNTAPQSFLDEELAMRGYSTVRYSTLEGGYHCRPNPLQLASFGNHLNQAVRQSDTKLLVQLLHCGLSPNACNKFGESIVHSVCRRGDVDALQTLLAGECSLQVSDDYGRTPLHDACWQSDNPCFDTVRRILETDKNLIFLKDIRGATPLSYVKKESHAQWIDFLMSEFDRFWPADGTGNQSPPPLTLQLPHYFPLPSQITNLSLEVISLIAHGQLPTTNQKLLAALVRVVKDEPMEGCYSESGGCASDSYYSDSDDSYDSDFCYDSDDDEDFDLGEEDLSDIKKMAKSPTHCLSQEQSYGMFPRGLV